MSEHLEFVKKHSKVAEGTNERKAPLSTCYDFMQDNFSINKETMKAVDTGMRAYVTAGARIATEDLAAAITACKENGQDPDEAVAKVSLVVPHGSVIIKASAKTEGRNPRTGESITNYGTIGIRQKLSPTLLDKEVIQEAHETIGKLMNA